MIWCHLCNRVSDEESYLDHLILYHQTTLFVIQAVALTQPRIVFPFYLNDTEDDEYENLLALCNEIGDHKIGIDDIVKVTTIIDKSALNSGDTCPICLEEFIEIEDDIYKLNSCNHSYCKECISTWCLENRICPVCKTYI